MTPLAEFAGLAVEHRQAIEGDRMIHRPGSLILLDDEVRLCRHHDFDDVVGVVRNARDGRRGLMVDLEVFDDEAAAWCTSSTPPHLSVGVLSTAEREPFGEAVIPVASVVVEVSLVRAGAYGSRARVRCPKGAAA